MVGKSSWCHAAALPVGTNIRFVKSDVTSTRRSLRRCRAFAAATFNCSDVNGGMSTGGGGGALITPVTVVAAVAGWLLAGLRFFGGQHTPNSLTANLHGCFLSSGSSA